MLMSTFCGDPACWPVPISLCDSGDAKENQASCSTSGADEGCGCWLAGSVDLKEVLRESHFKEIPAPAPMPKQSASDLQVAVPNPKASGSPVPMQCFM